MKGMETIAIHERKGKKYGSYFLHECNSYREDSPLFASAF
jgi:hypothetical protein